jgi:hypothetical protein
MITPGTAASRRIFWQNRRCGESWPVVREPRRSGRSNRFVQTVTRHVYFDAVRVSLTNQVVAGHTTYATAILSPSSEF